MDPQHLTIMATLNERGKQLGFAERERLITPFRFALSVGASMANEQVESIADLHRQFNDLWDLDSKTSSNPLPSSEKPARSGEIWYNVAHGTYGPPTQRRY